MANLSTTTEYELPGQAFDIAKRTANVPTPASFPSVASAAQASAPTQSPYLSPPSMYGNQRPATVDLMKPQGVVPPYQPAVPSLVPGSHTEPLPSWNSGFSPAQSNGGYQWSNPTPGAMVNENLKVPEPAGIGQMTLDTSNPGALVHSIRQPTPQEDIDMLGGRSSKLYQIDHIIPLWAGGADTPTNKEVVPTAFNKLKTNAQAVALTLLAHGEINVTQARSLALSWTTRDLTDLPQVDSSGLLTLKQAEDIKSKWDSQSNTPNKGMFGEVSEAGGGNIGLSSGYGTGGFLKGFWDSVPEGTSQVINALGGLGKGYLPQPIQDAVGGILEGAASGLTGGWASAPDTVHPSTVRSTANIVGAIGGSLIPIGMLTRGIGVTPRAITGLTALSKVAAAKAGFGAAGKSAAVGADVLADAEGIASTLGSDLAQEALNLPKGGPSYIKSLGLGTAVKNALGFAAYGQIGPEGLLGKVTGQQEADPMSRFFQDLSFGAMSGIAPPNLKGVASSAVLPLILGPMFDPQHPQNWLVNAGVMAGLHGLGIPGARSKIAASMQQYNDSVTRLSLSTILHPYVGDLVPVVGKGEVAPFESMNQADFADNGIVRKTALENLFAAASGQHPDDVSGYSKVNPKDVQQKDIVGFSQDNLKNMTYDQWKNEAEKITAATRHVWKQFLDPVARAKADSEDLVSVVQRIKQSPPPPPGKFATPSIVNTAKDVLDEHYMKNSLKSADGQMQSGNNITGHFPLTGLASNVNTDTEEFKYYESKVKTGKASPNIFLYSAPETAPFWRNMNLSQDPEAIKNKEVTPFAHPENAVRAFGLVYDEAGNREAIDLGWVSRQSRIEGRKNSWNSHPSVKKYIDTNGAEGIAPFDPSLNKDSVADTMKKNGVRVAIANRGIFDPATKSSNEPFVSATMNDANWNASKDLASKMANTGVESRSTMPELIANVNHGLDAREKTASISEIKNRVKQPAVQMMKEMPVSKAMEPHKAVAQRFMSFIQEAISSDSPEQLMSQVAEKMGVILNEDEATAMISRKNEISAKDVFDTLSRAADDGRMMHGDKTVFDKFVKPLFESPDFRRWQMAKVFPSMRVMGGITQPKAVPSANVDPMATIQAPAIPADSSNATASLPTDGGMPSMQPTLPNMSPFAQKIVQIAAQTPYEGKITPTPSDTYSPTSVTPPGEQAIGQRTQPARSKDVANELYSRATEVLRTTDPSYYTSDKETGGALGYAKQLMSVVHKLQPNRAGISRVQATAIKTAVSKQLERDVMSQVKNAFDLTWQETDTIMRKATGGGKEFVPLSSIEYGRITDEISGNPKNIYSGVREPNDTNTIHAPEQPKDFFEKDPFFNTSGYDVLKSRRDKAGQDLLDWVDFGKQEGQPESYLHAFSFGMDEGLKTMFGPNYQTAAKQFLGRAFGTEGRTQRKMSDLYETTNTSKELKSITQTKDYLNAMGLGDRTGMKKAEDARMAEVKQEQADSDARLPSQRMQSTEDASGNYYGAGNEQDTGQIGQGSAGFLGGVSDNKVVGLTRGDTALLPGLTSIDFAGASDTGPEAARRGIEDARNILQFIMSVHNDAVGTAVKANSKTKQSFVTLTGQKQYTGRWANLSLKQQTEVKAQTDQHFENLYKNYMKSINGGINKEYSSVAKAVKKATN